MGRNVSKRPLEILRRAQGGVPRESGALSRQPAVLLTYGIGGMYELGFGSSPDRGKHSARARSEAGIATMIDPCQRKLMSGTIADSRCRSKHPARVCHRRSRAVANRYRAAPGASRLGAPCRAATCRSPLKRSRCSAVVLCHARYWVQLRLCASKTRSHHQRR